MERAGLPAAPPGACANAELRPAPALPAQHLCQRLDLASAQGFCTLRSLRRTALEDSSLWAFARAGHPARMLSLFVLTVARSRSASCLHPDTP